MRTLGLLRELSKANEIDMLVLTRQPLSKQQIAALNKLADNVIRIPLKDVAVKEKILALTYMVKKKLPYHSAVLISSLRDHPEIRRRIESYPGIVFSNNGHWGALVHDRRALNWILNQCDADVDFWRVYMSHARNLIVKAASFINWRLAKPHFKKIYQQVGRIISVCEEDKRLTQKLAPSAKIDIIENGIDCSLFTPDKDRDPMRPPRILFTGTSVRRNITALRWFTRKVFPLIRKSLPDVEFLVAGNFHPKAQKLFNNIPGIVFTGRVEDIRPCFNQSDIYVAPFLNAHGSKLKVAEAMAMAMPLVSTTAGIRGFPLKNGESVLIAETPDAFAQKCIELLKNASLRFTLGNSARYHALNTIDWRILGERLRGIVNEHKANMGMKRSESDGKD